VHDYIGFYPREYYALDNFSSFCVEFEGRLYKSVEEAYQALSFKDSAPEIYDRIKNSRSAYEAKKIAHENLLFRRKNWDDEKIQIMENLLKAKLNQHEYVKKKLLETGDYLICEDSSKDSFWGIGADRMLTFLI